MIMEICQTLLLYTEPKKREKEDRFEKMKFRMQLSAGEDTKGDIQELQNCVRYSPLLRLILNSSASSQIYARTTTSIEVFVSYVIQLLNQLSSNPFC